MQGDQAARRGTFQTIFNTRNVPEGIVPANGALSFRKACIALIAILAYRLHLRSYSIFRLHFLQISQSERGTLVTIRVFWDCVLLAPNEGSSNRKMRRFSSLYLTSRRDFKRMRRLCRM